VLEVGNLRLDILIKEITGEDEFAAYQSLADQHYRGKALHGRTAKLIARCFHPMYPAVVGYIEIATPFYMNKPRSVILNAPFSDSEIQWDTWDIPTLRRYIHLFVRIARCVVFPEFRGLSLGRLLVKHAGSFARDHWQVARLKPKFIEISADMLKFVPFSKRAGMVFIGGNGRKSAPRREGSALSSGQSGPRQWRCRPRGGLRDRRAAVARMAKAAELMRRENWSVDDLMERLDLLERWPSLRNFTMLGGLLSLPKPTYLRGLTEAAHAFVRRRVDELGITNGNHPAPPVIDPVNEPLRFRDLSLAYTSVVRRTQKTAPGSAGVRNLARSPESRNYPQALRRHRGRPGDSGHRPVGLRQNQPAVHAVERANTEERRDSVPLELCARKPQPHSLLQAAY